LQTLLPSFCFTRAAAFSRLNQTAFCYHLSTCH
jgi:hypothetical protein